MTKQSDARITVTAKTNARLGLYINLIHFLYAIRLTKLADKLFGFVLYDIEKDVSKYIKITH